jgi:hypothetical protein
MAYETKCPEILHSVIPAASAHSPLLNVVNQRRTEFWQLAKAKNARHLIFLPSREASHPIGQT